MCSVYSVCESLFAFIASVGYWWGAIYIIVISLCITWALYSRPKYITIISDFSPASIRKRILDGNYYWSKPESEIEKFLLLFGNSVPHRSYCNKKVKAILFYSADSLEDILENIKKKGYRPGTFVELLDFGISFPQEQNDCSIIALDAIISNGLDGLAYPCLAINKYEDRILKIENISPKLIVKPDGQCVLDEKAKTCFPLGSYFLVFKK